MRIVRKCLLSFIILIFTVACQQTLVSVEATVTLSPIPPVALDLRPTPTPQALDLPTLTATAVPPPTTILAAAPTIPPPPLIESDSAPAPTLNLTPLSVLPTLAPADNTFVVGQSVQGRDILAWRFGSGERILLLVGGIHAGFEANTVMLINELIAHFGGTPADVLPGMSIVLIPVANPDGLVLGRQTSGRFNANGVDLNRNWGCEWKTEAYWRNQRVDPGANAFSEPETRAIAEWIRTHRPAGAVFYHAAARGVFAGNCRGDHGSAAFAAVLGEASGYPYGEAWSAYPVSGTASTWVDGLGIPAVDLELTGTRETEFLPNLRGIIAVQCWLIRDLSAAYPVCG
jgi:hypothetical protein